MLHKGQLAKELKHAGGVLRIRLPYDIVEALLVQSDQLSMVDGHYIRCAGLPSNERDIAKKSALPEVGLPDWPRRELDYFVLQYGPEFLGGEIWPEFFVSSIFCRKNPIILGKY